jgi:hypothetical protein
MKHRNKQTKVGWASLAHFQIDVRWGWWSSTTHFLSHSLTTYTRQCIRTRPHKRGGLSCNLQLALQVKNFKLQTNSLNKHYPQKCKTRSKQTKGRGGQVVITSRGNGKVNGARWHTSPYVHVYAPTTYTRECIRARPHKGENKNSRWEPTQDNTRTRPDKGKRGWRTFNKKSSLFLFSFKAKKKPHVGRGGGGGVIRTILR